MKRTRLLMGMPITIEVVDPKVTESDIAGIFDYFASVDRMFSPYKKESEISRLNAGELTKKQLSTDVRQILQRSEEHTSELQSPDHLVCRLLLEKKKNTQHHHL